MVENIDAELTFDILGTESARAILQRTSEESHTAYELAERCEASLPTIYRQVKRLTKHDLLEATVRFDDDGSRYTEYRTNVDFLAIRVNGGDMEVVMDSDQSVGETIDSMTRDKQMLENFERVWDEYEREIGGL